MLNFLLSTDWLFWLLSLCSIQTFVQKAWHRQSRMLQTLFQIILGVNWRSGKQRYMVGIYLRCLQHLSGTVVGKDDVRWPLQAKVPLGPHIPEPLLIGAGNASKLTRHCIFNLWPNYWIYWMSLYTFTDVLIQNHIIVNITPDVNLPFAYSSYQVIKSD